MIRSPRKYVKDPSTTIPVAKGVRYTTLIPKIFSKLKAESNRRDEHTTLFILSSEVNPMKKY